MWRILVLDQQRRSMLALWFSVIPPSIRVSQIFENIANVIASRKVRITIGMARSHVLRGTYSLCRSLRSQSSGTFIVMGRGFRSRSLELPSPITTLTSTSGLRPPEPTCDHALITISNPNLTFQKKAMSVGHKISDWGSLQRQVELTTQAALGR